jgi:DNA-binding PadR family transcriptional regulator
LSDYIDLDVSTLSIYRYLFKSIDLEEQMRDDQTRRRARRRGMGPQDAVGTAGIEGVGPMRQHRGEHGPRVAGWDRGGRGERPGGGRRGRRGDVRSAILELLAERPMHGYEMLQELAERTQGLWRPSPGSLYPALQLLEDQELVVSVTADGRRRYELTDAGRAAKAERPSGPAPWETMLRDADKDDMALGRTMRQVAIAIRQVAEAGSASQKLRAKALLEELRRQTYLLLAETPESDGDATTE